MRLCRATTGACLAAATVLLSAGPAASSTVVAYYHMDDGAGATTMVDTSGFANHGQPRNVVSGVLGTAGYAYSFPQQSIVSVPSAPSLNPGGGDFVVSLYLMTSTTVRDGESPNVLQKGRYNTPGGQYKLQLLPSANRSATIPQCMFHGSEGRVSVAGGPDIADGQWHHVVCVKHSTSIALQVDDGTIYRAYGTAGSIGNGDPLTLGTPILGNDDQYVGRIDEVALIVA